MALSNPLQVIASPTDILEYSRDMCRAGIGDGLPMVPPTMERVDEMLGGRDPARDLGKLPPLFASVTVRDVAICAVMAGCDARHLSTLIASVQGLQAPEFNLMGIVTTTGSAAVGMILHGPAVSTIAANSGANCLGPGNVTNATVGRALATLLRAVSGARIGVTDMAVMGSPAKYGLCFAEAWPSPLPSLVETRGIAQDESAVSLIAVSGTVEVVDTESTSVTGLLDSLCGSIISGGPSHADGHCLGSGQPLLVVPPEWANRIEGAGWSLAQLKEYLAGHLRVLTSALPASTRAALSPTIQRQGFASFAPDYRKIEIVVAGGVGTKATYLPTWHGGSDIVVRAIP